MSTSSKDALDKAQTISIIFVSVVASVVMPIALAYLTNVHGTALQESQNQIRYLELAISILKENPKPETRALRDWAVDLLAAQSKSIVPLTEAAKAELKATKAFQFAGDGGYTQYDVDYGNSSGFGQVGPGCHDCSPSNPSSKSGTRHPNANAAETPEHPNIER